MSQAALLDIEGSHPQIATSFTTDAGTAIPIANDLEILGTNGINTIGSGKTVTVSLPTTINGQLLIGVTATGIPIAGTLTSGNGITVSEGAGSITIDASLTAGDGISITEGGGAVTISAGSTATSFNGDSGTAVPSSNIITMAGNATQGLVTSATGSTVTFTNSDATSAQKGVSEMATNTETVAGTDTTRSVTPSGVETKLGNVTLNGLIVGGGAGQQLKVTSAMTNGMLAIGSTSATPVAATITAGVGISVTNGAGSITIDNTGGSFDWNVVTDATQAMAIQNGYVGNRATTITYTIPTTAAVGSVIELTNIGAGLPVIAQNAGESIHFAASTTTVGVGGSLTAVDQFCSIELVCVVADTDWAVLSSVGNWTIV